MKLKELLIPVTLVVALSLSLGVAASAPEPVEAAPRDLGLTPDNPFYFIDQWHKLLEMEFAPKAEDRCRLALNYADERLSEAIAMVDLNRNREATRAAREYQNYLATAGQNLEPARRNGVDFSEEMALMAQKQLGLINKALCNDTPERTRTLLARSQDRALASRETAVRSLTEDNPARAAQLNLKLMGIEMDQAREKSGQPPAEGL
jgi:hypothetical protein